MNGDPQAAAASLEAQLRSIRYPTAHFSVAEAAAGFPAPLLPALGFALLRFSPHITRMLAEHGLQLHGASDQRFVEGALKFARDGLGLRPPLTAQQFLSQSFAERKLQLVAEIVRACRERHNAAARQERLAALKGVHTEQRLYGGASQHRQQPHQQQLKASGSGIPRPPPHVRVVASLQQQQQQDAAPAATSKPSSEGSGATASPGTTPTSVVAAAAASRWPAAPPPAAPPPAPLPPPSPAEQPRTLPAPSPWRPDRGASSAWQPQMQWAAQQQLMQQSTLLLPQQPAPHSSSKPVAQQQPAQQPVQSPLLPDRPAAQQPAPHAGQLQAAAPQAHRQGAPQQGQQALVLQQQAQALAVQHAGAEQHMRRLIEDLSLRLGMAEEAAAAARQDAQQAREQLQARVTVLEGRVRFLEAGFALPAQTQQLPGLQQPLLLEYGGQRTQQHVQAPLALQQRHQQHYQAPVPLPLPQRPTQQQAAFSQQRLHCNPTFDVQQHAAPVPLPRAQSPPGLHSAAHWGQAGVAAASTTVTAAAPVQEQPAPPMPPPPLPLQLPALPPVPPAKSAEELQRAFSNTNELICGMSARFSEAEDFLLSLRRLGSTQPGHHTGARAASGALDQ